VELVAWGFKEEITFIGCKLDLAINLSLVILSKWALGSLWSSVVKISKGRNPEEPLEMSIRSWPEVACRKCGGEKADTRSIGSAKERVYISQDLCQRMKMPMLVTK
jgi:hypothetical protein